MVLAIDAAPVVGDLKDSKAEFGPAADSKVAGNSGPAIFERVIDQVGEGRLQRQAVRDDVRQRLDTNLWIVGGQLRPFSNGANDRRNGGLVIGQAAVLARAIDEDDRGGADRDQHQESRAQAAGFAQWRASA